MAYLYRVKIIALADVENWLLGKSTFFQEPKRQVHGATGLTAEVKLYYRFIMFYCTQTHCVSGTSNHLTIFQFMPYY
jgi:hypothetical protein